MKAIRRAVARIGAIFRGHGRDDEELRAEMEAHLDMATAENIRRGMPPDEARRKAVLATGGLTQAAESVRAQRGVPSVESVVADIRYAVRHFRRTPLSTATMIVVLSLGIGTTVVLFTILNSIATMPAPGIARDESLVRIRGSMSDATGVRHRLLSWPEVQEYTGRTDLFSAVAAHADEVAAITTADGNSTPLTAAVIYSTANYFDVLEIRPVVGRVPSAERDPTRLATSPTAMISFGMWQQRFGSAPDVVGRTVRVNDVPVEIVGVAPPRFLGTSRGSAMTMWVPLAAYPLLQQRSTAVFTSGDSLFLSAAARLRPGVTQQAATATVAGIAERASSPTRDAIAAQAPNPNASPAIAARASAAVVPMLARNDRISDARRADLILSGAAAGGFALLVLLITCTNVSALMVGLAVARRREIGVRLSLGAPRQRLIRQLLTESVLLALIAATVGLVVTMIGIRALGATLDGGQLAVDWRVVVASSVVAVATGILFGLSPALHATRVSVGEVLKSSAASVAATRSRLQRALVVAQIALTQPLLVGLGVIVTTMVSDIDSATSNVPGQIAEIELDTWAGRVTDAERVSRIAAAVDRVGAMPGVIAAMPMQMGTVIAPLAVHPADRIAGIAYAPSMEAHLSAAPRGYFAAFGIPIVRGRDFDAAEHAQGAGADPGRAPSFDRVIIGSDLARRLWGEANPLGRRLILSRSARPDSAPMVVIGVVDESVAGASEVEDQIRIYVPYSAMNTGVIARTAGPALPLLNAMRQVVAEAAPQMPISRAQTMEQREADARRGVVRASGAVAVGGLLALLLSAVGLYAVVSFAVGQRTREIGIRTALGAQSGQVIRLFFAKGLALSALGLLVGLPLSLLVIRLVDTTLDWPLTSSPLLGVAIALVVLVVASVAVWIPARRASTIDPVLALRSE